MLAAAAIIFAGCKKDPIEEPTDTPETPSATTAYVLNEGNWGGNDASISLLDFTTGAITNDYFAQNNGRGLGDVAQDLAAYGGKLYAVVTFSNTVEVINRASGKSTQIDFGSRNPRYIAFSNGKAYVSCYSPASIVRIDTATLAIEATCTLSGLPPEQLCIAGNTLYVANGYTSDANSNFTYDSVVTAVNLSTFSETARIKVGYNPTKLSQLDASHIAIAYAGDYGAHSGGTAILNTADNSVQQLAVAATNMAAYHGNLYLYCATYDANWNSTYHFYKVDGATLQSTEILTADASRYNSTTYPYGISVNPANGDIYVMTASYGANGDVHCYSQNGTKRWTAEAGQFPSRVVF